MKISKIIIMTFLLIISLCAVRPSVVNAEEYMTLDNCEKKALKNIFNKAVSEGKKVDTKTTYLENEYDKVRCECSYIDCDYNVENSYDLEKKSNFVTFASAFFSYINAHGNFETLNKKTNKNKNITEFDELIDICVINDTDIGKYYDCSVNDKCVSVPMVEDTGKKCTGFISKEASDTIKEIFDFIRLYGSLTIILYSVLDLLREVSDKYKGDEEALSTTREKLKKRALIIGLLIIIPTILKLIFKAIEGFITIPTDCVMLIQNMFLRR